VFGEVRLTLHLAVCLAARLVGRARAGRKEKTRCPEERHGAEDESRNAWYP